eukprot:m.242265 g.242265  ORF g.242265 m.242265 type:complete len:1066 (-) comp26595_c6_seq2:1448-4645(-)
MCTNCTAGSVDHDSQPSTQCEPCSMGHFAPAGSVGNCSKFTCEAGTVDADSNAATPCVACVVGQGYQPDGGETACLPVATCRAGEQEALEPTRTSNRICVPCQFGISFKAEAGNEQACQAVRQCDPEAELEIVAPTLTSDRECAIKTTTTAEPTTTDPCANVVCEPISECHVPGVCIDGQCFAGPAKADDSPCSATTCRAQGSCQRGVCEPGNVLDDGAACLNPYFNASIDDVTKATGVCRDTLCGRLGFNNGEVTWRPFLPSGVVTTEEPTTSEPPLECPSNTFTAPLCRHYTSNPRHCSHVSYCQFDDNSATCVPASQSLERKRREGECDVQAGKFIGTKDICLCAEEKGDSFLFQLDEESITGYCAVCTDPRCTRLSTTAATTTPTITENTTPTSTEGQTTPSSDGCTLWTTPGTCSLVDECIWDETLPEPACRRKFCHELSNDKTACEKLKGCEYDEPNNYCKDEGSDTPCHVFPSSSCPSNRCEKVENQNGIEDHCKLPGTQSLCNFYTLPATCSAQQGRCRYVFEQCVASNPTPSSATTTIAGSTPLVTTASPVTQATTPQQTTTVTTQDNTRPTVQTNTTPTPTTSSAAGTTTFNAQADCTAVTARPVCLVTSGCTWDEFLPTPGCRDITCPEFTDPASCRAVSRCEFDSGANFCKERGSTTSCGMFGMSNCPTRCEAVAGSTGVRPHCKEPDTLSFCFVYLSAATCPTPRCLFEVNGCEDNPNPPSTTTGAKLSTTLAPVTTPTPTQSEPPVTTTTPGVVQSTTTADPITTTNPRTQGTTTSDQFKTVPTTTGQQPTATTTTSLPQTTTSPQPTATTITPPPQLSTTTGVASTTTARLTSTTDQTVSSQGTTPAITTSTQIDALQKCITLFDAVFCASYADFCLSEGDEDLPAQEECCAVVNPRCMSTSSRPAGCDVSPFAETAAACTSSPSTTTTNARTLAPATTTTTTTITATSSADGFSTTATTTRRSTSVLTSNSPTSKSPTPSTTTTRRSSTRTSTSPTSSRSTSSRQTSSRSTSAVSASPSTGSPLSSQSATASTATTTTTTIHWVPWARL